MQTKKEDKKVKFLPLIDSAVDELIDCMEKDFDDIFMELTTNLQARGTQFDMWDPDNWELHKYALDDIRDYIDDLREHAEHAKGVAEGNQRGTQYWKSKCEREVASQKSICDYWRKKYDSDTTKLKQESHNFKSTSEAIRRDRDYWREKFKELEKKVAV